MQSYNYSHSEYMLPSETFTIEEMCANHDYARFLHYADVFKYKMDELEAAGLLADGLQMRCLVALQHAQYTQTYVRAIFVHAELDAALAKLPTYEAPKPNKIARFFSSLAA